jgi:excisionase family DNA binding protein
LDDGEGFLDARPGFLGAEAGADEGAFERVGPVGEVTADPARQPRGLDSVGARGFEPPTFCSQIYEDGFPGDVKASQPSEMITETESSSVQPSQAVAENPKNFTTRLLPNSEKGLADPLAGQLAAGMPGAPNTAPASATTPTLADLGFLYGGRDRLLRASEVADRLGVSTATVYKLCKSGDLPHVRIVDSIRVRPADLAKFLCRG